MKKKEITSRCCKRALLFVFLLQYAAPAVFSQRLTHSLSLVSPGDTLHLISSQFAFSEGPAVDRAGNIYFTDQPRDQIWKYDTTGKLSLYREKTGRSNGLYIDRDGNLVACADEQNQLWRINRNKKVDTLLTGFGGKRFNGPNDLWIDRRGGIYFTDPYYQREYWERKKPELERQSVYYLPKAATTAHIVDSTLLQPNGIVGTPDGNYLYVADIRANKTYRYHIDKKGNLTDKMLFVSQGSDGMTLDDRGNLYLCGKGVTIYDSAGTELGTIPVPSPWVGNACFGGPQRNILFITASESVYSIKMLVKGVE